MWIFGVLASSYGDKSQILMELGRFREAISFDEKAMEEIQRCIDAGDGHFTRRSLDISGEPWKTLPPYWKD